MTFKDGRFGWKASQQLYKGDAFPAECQMQENSCWT